MRGRAAILLPALLLLPQVAAAQPASVNGVRLGDSGAGARIVFDLSTATPHHLFTLSNPPRLVVDMKNTRLRADLPQPRANHPLIQRLRDGKRNGNDLRIVLDLRELVRPKTQLLKAGKGSGKRLVVDLQPLQAKPGSTARPVSKRVVKKRSLRDVVVAIDAGHGGNDPGARGKAGTREKDVVLAIARKLATLVRKEPGMRPVLTRNSDRYVSLRDRMAKARKHRADVFISIHADAFRDARVSGSSVFTLSPRGAGDEAARWLAERENAADLVGGVSLEDKDDLLASVLLDLSQTATRRSSTQVAEAVLSNLKRLGKTHKRRVQRAGFVVLKSPDIPSILVETAFISNRAEERKLRDARHQGKIAGAILKGVRSYFSNNPPPGTHLAARRRHIIARGDTLSEIAQKYHVSIKTLRSRNAISSDRIRPGQVLLIPEG